MERHLREIPPPAENLVTRRVDIVPEADPERVLAVFDTFFNKNGPLPLEFETDPSLRGGFMRMVVDSFYNPGNHLAVESKTVVTIRLLADYSHSFAEVDDAILAIKRSMGGLPLPEAPPPEWMWYEWIGKKLHEENSGDFQVEVASALKTLLFKLFEMTKEDVALELHRNVVIADIAYMLMYLLDLLPKPEFEDVDDGPNVFERIEKSFRAVTDRFPGIWMVCLLSSPDWLTGLNNHRLEQIKILRQSFLLYPRMYDYWDCLRRGIINAQRDPNRTGFSRILYVGGRYSAHIL